MADKFLRLPQVTTLTGRPKSTLYADIKKNAFPKPIKIGARASAWLESDVHTWMAQRVAGSRVAA